VSLADCTILSRHIWHNAASLSLFLFSCTSSVVPACGGVAQERERKEEKREKKRESLEPKTRTQGLRQVHTLEAVTWSEPVLARMALTGPLTTLGKNCEAEMAPNELRTFTATLAPRNNVFSGDSDDSKGVGVVVDTEGLAVAIDDFIVCVRRYEKRIEEEEEERRRWRRKRGIFGRRRAGGDQWR